VAVPEVEELELLPSVESFEAPEEFNVTTLEQEESEEEMDLENE